MRLSLNCFSDEIPKSFFQKKVPSFVEKTFVVLFLVLIMARGAYAMNARNLLTTEYEVGNAEIPVAISLSTGVLNGESHELVYYGNYKVSELIWRLEDVVVVGGEASVGLTESTTLNLGVWGKVANTDAKMDDYDWLDPIGHPGEWTDWTESETDLEKGLMLDINTNTTLTSSDSAVLSAIFGFRHDHYNWDAMGANGTHSYYSFRDTPVYISSEHNVISYEQELYAPYVGLGIDYTKNKWLLSTSITGSLWAWADAKDYHYYSDGSKDTYEDSFEQIAYLNLGTSASYFIKENLYFTFNFDCQKYYKTKGDTKATYYDGYVEKYNDGAGTSHESYMLGLSTTYLF